MDPLQILSGLQLTLGRLGVMIFFVISGFLVTMSYEKSKSNMDYLKKRCLRLFPGLFAFTILAPFVKRALLLK